MTTNESELEEPAMKDSLRTKFVSDINVTDAEWRVRPPFHLQQDNRRRFVRLEISSPMSLRKLKDIFGNFWPTGGGYAIEGTILNVSPGGVLVETDQPMNEGDLVVMQLTLQGAETLDHVLGAVKRSDQLDDCFLAGVEFIGRDRLRDQLSQAELDILTDDLSDFTHSVQEVLAKYVYRERVAPPKV
ncbi:MAG TPA: PilZ domain-containing protein [Candidatus Deferrimicrobium sp.]|nr:PilZ domain-containing protein [Candidatus Deferrimicrobium sp.]